MPSFPGLKRFVEFIRQQGAVPGIQLGHSGRKARRFRPWEGGAPLKPSPEIDDWDAWELVSSSGINSPESDPTAARADARGDPGVIERWGQAARRAHEAGFDVLEIHGAHGYLIHQFLSPFSNLRNDEYGGSELNRMRFCIEVVESVRAPLAGRTSRCSCASRSRTMPAGGRDQSVALAKHRQAQGRRRDRLQLGRHARLAGGERRAGRPTATRCPMPSGCGRTPTS